ncbi:hypothetical protein [Clostridium diolis]|uniref:hypothetical protein n=1 Tax=Clostridium diolis TaxID=223919 RepID=UPI003AF9446D
MYICRKKRYSVVSVSRECSCGFLTVEVVPISACSCDKRMTSKNQTTSTEEIPTAAFSMKHYTKEYLFFLV